MPGNANHTTIRLQFTQEDPNQSGFADTVASNKPYTFAILEGKGDILEDLGLTDELADPLDTDQPREILSSAEHPKLPGEFGVSGHHRRTCLLALELQKSWQYDEIRFVLGVANSGEILISLATPVSDPSSCHCSQYEATAARNSQDRGTQHLRE